MSQTLEQMIGKLTGTQLYQALSQEEIEKQASRRYQSVYDQKRLSAQQAYETGDAALLRELSGLQLSYDRERGQSEAQTRLTRSAADRQALSRGMQRSSYTGATLANIDLAGEAALREIGRRQTEDETDVQEKRTQLAQQLSQQIKQYDADQQSDMLAYADELTAREYDRVIDSQNTVNNLAMKIYEYQHQLEIEAVEQARWEAEFEAKYGGLGGGGGGGGGSGRKSKSNSKGSLASSKGLTNRGK